MQAPVGVDRLAALVQLSAIDKTPGPPGALVRSVRGKTVHVRVFGVGNPTARVEFNPSGMVGGSKHDACPPEDVQAALELLWTELDLDTRLERRGPLDEALISRIDLMRDFHDVEHFSFIVVGLSLIPERTMGRRELWSGADGQLQGLRIGGRQLQLKLYDKHLQTRGAVERGRVRWEAQLMRPAAKRYRLETVGDITRERVDQVAVELWERSLMGTTVASGATLIAAVEAMDWSDPAKSAFLGDAIRISAGSAPHWFNDRRSKHRRLRRELGLAPGGDLLLSSGNPFAYQLDFGAGTEVAVEP